MEMEKEENHYLELFGVSRANLESLMAGALSSGADFADIYLECTSYTNLLLKDSQVTSGGYSFPSSLSFRRARLGTFCLPLPFPACSHTCLHKCGAHSAFRL